MEAVAAVATIAQLVEFSGQILAHGYGFLARVSGAPNEIRNLLAEVANVNLILDRVHELTKESQDNDVQTTVDRLIDIGALDNCRDQLQRSQKCLEDCKPTGGHGVANIGRKIRWAIVEKDVRNMIEQLRALQAQISQAISLDTALVSMPLFDLRLDSHCA